MIFLLYALVGQRIGQWLFKYAFNAGNVLATIVALITPYLVRFNLLPALYHPYRYGGIPFVPPSFFEYQSMYYVAILAILTIMYLLSGFMAIYKICNKPPIESYTTILYNITKFLIVMIVCLSILFFLPLIKYPLLSTLIILPYANELVNGIFWSLFTLFGVTWANIDNIDRICGVNAYLDI